MIRNCIIINYINLLNLLLQVLTSGNEVDDRSDEVIFVHSAVYYRLRSKHLRQ